MEHDRSLGLSGDVTGFYAAERSWHGTDLALFGAGQGRSFSLLSNMAHCSINLRSVQAPSSESLYQASRFPNHRRLQREVASLEGLTAKRIARLEAINTTPDWIRRRRVAMFVVLNFKLTMADVSYCLLRTEVAPIVEVSRDDPFWGAVRYGEDLHGANLLGRMWMALRSMRDLQRGVTYRWALEQSAALWPHID